MPKSFHPVVVQQYRVDVLEQSLFSNANNLERKLADFRQYYNSQCSLTALDGTTPTELSEKQKAQLADLNRFH
jgi:hypothetical protein